MNYIKKLKAGLHHKNLLENSADNVFLNLKYFIGSIDIKKYNNKFIRKIYNDGVA